jgi:hypothetical protein
LRNSRKLSSILFDVGKITTYEYLRMAGRVKVAVDKDAAAPVRRHTKQLAKR